jgi:hypothetical protein
MIDPARLGEHIHGPLGWLSAAALVHPALLLRRPSRPLRAHLAVSLAAGIVTLAAILGAILYPSYRERLRQPIFASSMTFGYLFERKEHLAFGAVFLAWAGAITYASQLGCEDAVTADALRKASHRAFVAAAAFAVVTAILGTLVASYRSF